MFDLCTVLKARLKYTSPEFLCISGGQTPGCGCEQAQVYTG